MNRFYSQLFVGFLADTFENFKKIGDKRAENREKSVKDTGIPPGKLDPRQGAVEMPPTFALDRLLADLTGERVEGSGSAPSGEMLSRKPPNVAPLMENLPGSDTKRWVIRRKAAVVAAVRSGRITIEEACLTYQLSEEELLSWERAFEINGLAGLRTTRIQQYRRSNAARPRKPYL